MLGLGNSLITGGVISGYTNTYSWVGNGSNSHIDLEYHFENIFRDSFTISCWIKPDDGQPAANEYIFSSCNSAQNYVLGLILTTDGKLKFQIIPGATADRNTSGAIFADGAASAWKNIIVAVENPVSGSSNIALSIWVNGIPQSLAGSKNATGTQLEAWDANDRSMFIGAFNHPSSGAPLNYDGKIDEFAILSRKIDNTEALTIYNNGEPYDLVGTSDLYYYLKMNDVDGGTPEGDYTAQTPSPDPSGTNGATSTDTPNNPL